MQYITAAWPYEGKAETEISIEKDEVTVLVDDSNPEWWEIIKTDGSVGFVPANFVKKIDAADVDESTTTKLECAAKLVLKDVKRDSVYDEETDGPPVPPPARTRAPIPAARRPPSVGSWPGVAKAIPETDGQSQKPNHPPVMRRLSSNKGIAPTPGGDSSSTKMPRLSSNKGAARTSVGDKSASKTPPMPTKGMPPMPTKEERAAVALMRRPTTRQPSKEPELELLPHWTVTSDPSGKRYFYNTQTQESQWEPPHATPLPAGWIVVNNDNGNPYYYNKRTEISSWTRPNPDEGAGDLGVPPADGSDQSGAGGSGSGASGTRPCGILELKSPDVSGSDHDSEDDDLSLRGVRARKHSYMNPISDGSSSPSKSMLYESSIQKKVLLEKGKKGKRSWDTHFAQLKATHFMLFKDEKSVRQKKMGSTKAQMTFSLNHAQVNILDDPRKRFMFSIKTRDDNHLYIQCESESVVACWLRAIKINQQVLDVEPTPNEYDRPPFVVAEEVPKQGRTDINKKVSLKGAKKGKEDTLKKANKKGMKKSLSLNSTARLASATQALAGASLEEIDDATAPEEKKKMVKKRIFNFLQSRPGKDEVAEIIQTPYFGSTLELICNIENGKGASLVECVPNLVVLAIQRIEESGLNIEGMYRLSGTSTIIQKIKSNADQGEPIEFESYDDINAVSGALKLFFRDLEDPSVPFSMYEKFLAAMRVEDYNERLYALKDLVHKMPPQNYATLEYLFAHLRKISYNSKVNKMTPANLAIVFGPTLMKSQVETVSSILNMGYQNNLIELMIEQSEWLFSNDGAVVAEDEQ